MSNLNLGERDAVLPRLKRKRALILAISTIALFFLGLIYAFSMFVAPMCEAFGLDKSGVSITFYIMMIAFCFGGLAGSYIQKSAGLRAGLFVSAICYLVGFVGTAVFGHGSLVAVYVLYGCFAGFGVGVGYNCLVATANVWYPDKPGFSSGMLMMGFGVSALVLGNGAIGLIPALGLETVFSTLGILTCVLMFAASFVVEKAPANIAETMGVTSCGPAKSDPADDDRLLTSPTFWVYLLWAVAIMVIGLATIGSCASDAQIVGIDVRFAVLLVGLVSTCNGFGRLVIGVIYDKTNVKATALIIGVISMVASACILSAFLSGFGALYVIGALLCGFGYGGIPVVNAAFCRQRFGAKNYAFNLSIINFGLAIASGINILVGLGLGVYAEPRLANFVLMTIVAACSLVAVAPFARLWNRDSKSLEKRRQEFAGKASHAAEQTSSAQ